MFKIAPGFLLRIHIEETSTILIKRYGQMLAYIKKFNHFVFQQMWETDFKEKPQVVRFFFSAIKILWISIRNFNNNQSYLRASALTYWSVLSIVPVVALGFGISKGFGLENMLRKLMLEKIPMQEEALLKVLDFSHTLLENTKGGVVAGIGVVFLFWSVFKVLVNIENAFNHIWGISKSRPLGRNLGNYLSLMLLSPFLIILSGSMTVFISAEITKLASQIEILNLISPFLIYGIKYIPYLIIAFLLTLIYVLMPNTKVQFVSAVVGGVIASILYQLVQWVYIFFQVGVVRMNAIYGSFAALPLFLIWMQTSWVIVLYGTELTCAFQSFRKYRNYLNVDNLSFSLNKKIGLVLCKVIADQFASGKPPLTLQQICDLSGIPHKPAESVTNRLVETGILISEITKQQTRYIPAMDSEFLTIQKVTHALEVSGNQMKISTDSEEYRKINDILEKSDLEQENSPFNPALKEI